MQAPNFLGQNYVLILLDFNVFVIFASPLNIYLFDLQRWRNISADSHPKMAANARAGPGCKNLIFLFMCVAGIQTLGQSFVAFLQAMSKETDGKKSNWQMINYPYGMLEWQTVALHITPQLQPQILVAKHRTHFMLHSILKEWLRVFQ